MWLHCSVISGKKHVQTSTVLSQVLAYLTAGCMQGYNNTGIFFAWNHKDLNDMSIADGWQTCFIVLRSSSGVHSVEDWYLQITAEASCCFAGMPSAPFSIFDFSTWEYVNIIWPHWGLRFSALVYFPYKVRYASGRKGFLGEFVDNLRQEFSKNQEMKENIKKFREEAKRLEESDALQQARKKYVRASFTIQISLWDTISACVCYFLLKKSIEAETVKTSEVFKKTFGSLSDTVREVRYQQLLLFTV